MLDEIAHRFKRIAPAAEFWSLRLVDDQLEGVTVRQGVLQPLESRRSTGAFITVADRGGTGYAATSDLSRRGLLSAAREALRWARESSGYGLISAEQLPRPEQRGDYASRVGQAWETWNLEDRIAALRQASQRLKAHEAIVDWVASLHRRETHTRLLTSRGGELRQHFHYLLPNLRAVANRGAETQTRSYGYDRACQGGLEQLERLGFFDAAERVAAEALELLDAPNCPDGVMDLLLLPEQMMLQIHESIGHPLELDRILGDERNYAGTSFVTTEMFGTYRYGSELLNVAFDPEVGAELSSYAFDDEGTPAEKAYLIREGILQRPLGGLGSQLRAGLSGVAAARACDWNRPPIDRMANLNLEPGGSTFEQLVARIDRGVLMDTNRSWSIDDSRNKFQFGCEYGRLIEGGELRGVVRNPNYRGVSATFWRSLKGVGNTSAVMGTPTCGKGEPNQAIFVGHASPPCLFADVEVFGGA